MTLQARGVQSQSGRNQSRSVIIFGGTGEQQGRIVHRGGARAQISRELPGS